jgi:hypothetical protein
LLIVTLATAITLITALSISALATNMKVGGGGPITSFPVRSALRQVLRWGCLSLSPIPWACRFISSGLPSLSSP